MLNGVATFVYPDSNLRKSDVSPKNHCYLLCLLWLRKVLHCFHFIIRLPTNKSLSQTVRSHSASSRPLNPSSSLLGTIIISPTYILMIPILTKSRKIWLHTLRKLVTICTVQTVRHKTPNYPSDVKNDVYFLLLSFASIYL